MKTTKTKKKAAKSERVRVYTPTARLVYPYLAEIDSGRQYSNNKYHCLLMFDKATWKKEGAEFREKVLAVGRSFFKDKTMDLDDFPNPFQDGDSKSSDVFNGTIVVHPKSNFQPSVVGPDKSEFNIERIRQLKSGDYIRAVVSIFPYEQKGGGVTTGLEVVQFIKEGKQIGGGREASLSLVDEMEVEVSDLEDENDENEVEVDEEDAEENGENDGEEQDESEDEEEEDGDDEKESNIRI